MPRRFNMMSLDPNAAAAFPLVGRAGGWQVRGQPPTESGRPRPGQPGSQGFVRLPSRWPSPPEPGRWAGWSRPEPRSTVRPPPRPGHQRWATPRTRSATARTGGSWRSPVRWTSDRVRRSWPSGMGATPGSVSAGSLRIFSWNAGPRRPSAPGRRPWSAGGPAAHPVGDLRGLLGGKPFDQHGLVFVPHRQQDVMARHLEKILKVGQRDFPDPVAPRGEGRYSHSRTPTT